MPVVLLVAGIEASDVVMFLSVLNRLALAGADRTFSVVFSIPAVERHGFGAGNDYSYGALIQVANDWCQRVGGLKFSCRIDSFIKVVEALSRHSLEEIIIFIAYE